MTSKHRTLTEIDDIFDVVHLCADAAAIETLKWFRRPDLSIDNKDVNGFDPVTQADRVAEKAIRDVLAVHRPNDGIFGEEFGQTDGVSGLTWILDPIDGTRGYMSGTPTWGTLIAVADENGPVCGLIDQPYIGERFCGKGPHGAVLRRNGVETKITTSTRDGLDEAILFTTFPEVGTAQDRAGFDAVAKRCRQVRFGMDCYAYALVASGQVDLVIEAGLNSYDVAGPIAVIEAAGGIVTNWSGGRADLGGQVLAAGNAKMHAEALAILGEYADD